MSSTPKGHLIIIGGHEDKEGDEDILKLVAQRARGKEHSLVVVTVATQHPKQVGEEYQKLFKDLGAQQVEVIDIRTREEASQQTYIDTIDKAKVIFFTGGDQLRAQLIAASEEDHFGLVDRIDIRLLASFLASTDVDHFHLLRA